jgi:hypothetical protein
VLAGPIVENLSYHWLFWLPLIMIVIATVATLLYVPESPIKVPSTINWAAGFLMSAGLTTGLVAVSETTTWGWTSPKTIALLAVSGILLMVLRAAPRVR